MQDEEWRTVEGFPDYMISSLGRVASYKTPRRPFEMIASAGRDGYLHVVLCGGGRRKTTRVHTIVAAAFLGPRPEGHEILHGDGDKRNNALANLRYGTKSENSQDALRHGVHPTASKTHCPQGHPYDEANTYRPPANPTRRICKACFPKTYGRPKAA